MAEKWQKVVDFILGSHNFQVFIDIIFLVFFLYVSARMLYGLYFLLARHIAHAGSWKCFGITLFVAVGYAYLRSNRFGLSVTLAIPCAALMALFAIGYFGDIPFWRALLITPLFIGLTGGLLYGSTTLLDRGIPDRWTLARQFTYAEETIAGAIDPDSPGAKVKEIFATAYESLQLLLGNGEAARLEGQLDAGLSVLANSRQMATNQLIMMENMDAYAKIEMEGGGMPVSDGKVSIMDIQAAITELRALQKEGANSPPPDVGDAAEYLWVNMRPTNSQTVALFSLADNLAKVGLDLAMSNTNGGMDAATTEAAMQSMGQLMAIASTMNLTNMASSLNVGVGPTAAAVPTPDVGALLALASGIKDTPVIGPALKSAPAKAPTLGADLLLASKPNSPVAKYASPTSKWLSQEKAKPIEKPKPVVDPGEAKVMDLAAAMALMAGVPRDQVQGGSGMLLAAHPIDHVASLASPVSRRLSLAITPDKVPSIQDMLALQKIQKAVASVPRATATASSKAAVSGTGPAKKKVTYRKPEYLKTPPELKINGVISSGGKGGYILCNGGVVRIGSSVPVTGTNGVTMNWKLEVIENGKPGWSKSAPKASSSDVIYIGQSKHEEAK